MSNIVITGANRGIGLALASLYAERGDRVFAACREPSKAKELQRLAKAHALNLLPLDVGDGGPSPSSRRRWPTRPSTC